MRGLACEADRIAMAFEEQPLRHVWSRDASDQQHRLGRDVLDSASVLCLPACLELHRCVDECVVDACRDVHVVDIRLLLEVSDDALNLVELEIAGPEGDRVDPVADERLVADRLPDSPERLDREPQAVLVRAPKVSP